MKLTTNHNYNALNREIDFSLTWLRTKVSDTCGYSAHVVRERLIQRITEVLLKPYTLFVSRRGSAEHDPFPPAGVFIPCDRANFETGSGRVSVTAGQWLANQREFLAHWAFCLAAMLAGVFRRGRGEPAVLVFDVGEECLFVDGNDARFITYCRSSRIGPLRDGRRFIVQSISGHKSVEPRRCSYCRDPLIRLLHESDLGVGGTCLLMLKHFAVFVEYLRASLRLPALSLIARDFAYVSIAGELDRRERIEAMVLTISTFPCQPLWTRSLARAQAHMIWYSQNWKPLIYAAEPLDSHVPALRWVRADVHWVWTHAFADYYRKLSGSDDIHVIGPIVWYLPQTGRRSENMIKIVVFDVPAVDDDVLRDTQGELTNYFHASHMRAFIDDLVWLKGELEQMYELPVSMRLKMKRGYHADYNREHFDYLEALGTAGTVELEKYTTNIYALISGAHFVIAYPFTSPAYIAEHIGVPAIYYDPTGTILRHDFCDDRGVVSFAGSRQQLVDTASEIIGGAVRKSSRVVGVR